jgi:hypothetical protein
MVHVVSDRPETLDSMSFAVSASCRQFLHTAANPDARLVLWGRD